MSLGLAVVLLACGTPAPDDGGAADAGLDASAPGLDATITGPRYAFVGEETCFSVPPTSAEVTWSFGEGATASGPEGCHTWDFVGARTVGVVVVDGGRRAEATHSLTVVFRPSDPRPTRASPIAVDAARMRAWVVNPEADTVAVLSFDPPALLAERPVGARPRSLAIVGDVVAVACQDDGTLHLLDAETMTARAPVPMGGEPWAVIGDPRGGAFYVASRAGVVTSFGVEGERLDAVDVGPEPRGMAMNAEGALLVTRWRSDGEGARVQTLDARDPAAMVAGPLTLLPRQTDLDSDTDNSGAPSFLEALSFSPDGVRAMVAASKANDV
ncbi:MAG: hypothetical protein KC619_23930, partial [Myxococcales bacterium]|nr:hypothetical protein [Myxococcales bacterium]